MAAPKFTATAFDASATYSLGNVVYFTDGDCYRANQSTSAGESPVSAAAKWDKQELLEILADATKEGAFSLYTREEGQFNSSLLPDANMRELLLQEQEVLEYQSDQGNTIRVRVN